MRRAFVAIALTASLLASPGGRTALLDPFWTVLSSIWDAAGCGWDPNGQCNSAPQGDAGCGMDPNGCPTGS